MTEKNETLLVVDDDDYLSRLIETQLNNQGYKNLEFANDGVQALEVLRSKPIDLVLLDLEMPRMNGMAVLREVKSDLNLHDVPIVMVSGVDEIEGVAECIELGAEDYLQKPINPIIFRARVQSSLEKRKVRHLEEESRDELIREKQRADELLEVILPKNIAAELRSAGSVQPRRHEGIVLMFCDVVGFTSFCSNNPADVVVENLQKLFGRFEESVDVHGLTKIKTIGDAFMAEGGLTLSNPDPLVAAVKCGLEMIEETKKVCPGWEVRVGVAEGPVVAGIVGKDRFQFDLWGDTVNLAARMADVGQPGMVTMPHEYLLKADGAFEGRLLGEVPVKGKGSVRIVECSGFRNGRLVGENLIRRDEADLTA